MEFLKTSSGNPKLCWDGYTYTIHKTCATSVRWRCSKYNSFKCRALVTTDSSYASGEKRAEHNHPADPKHVEVVQAVHKMKERCKDTLAKPSQIYAEGVSALPRDVRSRMIKEDHLKRTFRSIKAAHNPKVPTSLSDLTIEDEWKTTGDPENRRFLLCDNGADAEERIVIFADDFCLRYLAAATTWYLDGNFSLAPRCFKQLYVIRVPVAPSGTIITAAYCLLEKKTQQTYENMLQILIDECAQRELFPDPAVLYMDFEKAAMQAATRRLGEHIRIRGCFYHLCQSTFRKVQELGLQKTYMESANLNNFCGKLDGLAFLPINDIKAGMDYLKTTPEAQEFSELLNYFDATYVSGTFRKIGNNPNSITIRNIAPLFSPELWNVHESTLTDEDRTNNQTEGWNNRFSNLVGQDHPSVWVLIKKMRMELAVDSAKLQNAELEPEVKKKRATYQVLQDRLKLLCQQYNNKERDLASFLNTIAHNIRFKSVSK